MQAKSIYPVRNALPNSADEVPGYVNQPFPKWCQSMKFRFLPVSMILCAATLSTHAFGGDDWSRFRGPNGTGVNANCDVPLPWAPKDIHWQIELPGSGNSSPVVRGDSVYLMSTDADSGARFLQAFSLRSGEQLWRRDIVGTPFNGLHARSSYASSSACVTEHGGYFSWASPDNLVLAALKHDGTPLWQRDLGRFVSQHGFGASPAAFGNLIVLFNSQAAEQLPAGVEPGVSSVEAFDAKTGDTVWSTKRKTTRVCYGVPTHFVDPNSGKDALLFADTGEGVFALDLATGSPLWSKRVFEKRSVACPVVVGDLAIATEGSGGGGNVLFAVDLKDPEHALKFSIDRYAPYVPSVVAKDDLLFLWSDRGMVSCVRVPSGEVAWIKRVSNPPVSSSPVIAGDKLIGISEEGTVTILAAADEFKEIGSVELGEPTRATPLVGEHYILFRTSTHLMCVGTPQ